MYLAPSSCINYQMKKYKKDTYILYIEQSTKNMFILFLQNAMIYWKVTEDNSNKWTKMEGTTKGNSKQMQEAKT